MNGNDALFAINSFYQDRRKIANEEIHKEENHATNYVLHQTSYSKYTYVRKKITCAYNII